MTKTPTEEAWESLATLVETKGAHWRLTDSPADDCVDVPVSDLRLALADRARLRDRVAALEGELESLIRHFEGDGDHDEGAFDETCADCVALAEARATLTGEKG